MKYNAFLNSLKIQGNAFRNEVIRTSNEQTYLDNQFKEFHRNSVLTLRSMENEKNEIEQLQRKIERERHKERISRSSRITNYGPSKRPQSSISKRHSNHETQSFDYYNEGCRPQTATLSNTSPVHYVPAPCYVLNFEKEKYTNVFSANANTTNLKISRHFPPPKQFVREANKKRMKRKELENSQQVHIPRVAFLKVSTPT